MNLWAIVNKNCKEVAGCFLYPTRKKARSIIKKFNCPKNYKIVKFVQEEPDEKRIKTRKDGFRYFHITNYDLLYRANKKFVEYAVNDFWVTSADFKTIQQLVDCKYATEVT